MATTSTTSQVRYLIDPGAVSDWFDDTKQPIPEGFTEEDLHDEAKRLKLATAFLGDSDAFGTLCDYLKEELRVAYGIVYCGCDPEDNRALTWDEAIKHYPCIERGNDEPGDDDGYLWYSTCVDEKTGFPTFGYDDEIHCAIAERYLEATDDTNREKQVFEALKRFFETRTIIKK